MVSHFFNIPGAWFLAVMFAAVSVSPYKHKTHAPDHVMVSTCSLNDHIVSHGNDHIRVMTACKAPYLCHDSVSIEL